MLGCDISFKIQLKAGLSGSN